MKYKNLGSSDLNVSEICLGTMTWGTQNTEAEGHAQMDRAVELGINFFDTAELYPVNPVSGATQGATEEIIGTWFEKSGKRDDIILATKICGGIDHIRGGGKPDAKNIRAALETSLQRLKTDYVDLYQLHWPNRGTYHFRRYWEFDASAQDPQESRDAMQEILETIDALVREGKIREFGLSNESVWGTSQFLQMAKAGNMPRVVSLQNDYGLMQRTFDVDLAEMAHHENIALMAYSPLAAGMLSGKYANGNIPKGSRLDINKDLAGRYVKQSTPALDAYLALAKEHGLVPAQMAIAFCLSRPFMGAAIIGATSVEQMEMNIGASDISLSQEVLEGIEAIFKRHPRPY